MNINNTSYYSQHHKYYSHSLTGKYKTVNWTETLQEWICISFGEILILYMILTSGWSTLNRGSSVNSVIRLRVGRPWFDYLQGLGFFSSPPRPDQVWGPPSLLSGGYWQLFLRGKVAGVLRWPLISICFRLWECVEPYIHTAISLHGVVFS